MPTDRWHRVEEIFSETVEQPPSGRAEFLRRACGDDADIQSEIASLLAASDGSDDFLSTPALDVFARQISREGWSVTPGDRIGCYVVERRLGSGGMGEVWQARDERLGRDVAIKLLLPRPSNTANRIDALRDEARAAGRLNHTNVLTVYDVGDHRGAPYLVTECLEGEALRARLAAGALPVDAALDIARQAARGLGAAHARGIVHRDLKPENIFLAVDGRVKILDFGLATLHDPTDEGSRRQAGSKTVTQPVTGTTAYMAPEQGRGEVDPRADVFALGAVLYEMLAGRRAFTAQDSIDGHAVAARQPPDLSALSPHTPPALVDIVRRCLARDPEERFTAADLATAVDAVIRAREPAAAPSVRVFFRRPMVMATALVAVVAIAAGGWRWQVITSRARWARTVAAPEARRLFNQGSRAEAFFLARQALDVVPDDPQLTQLWLDVSVPATLTTDPDGADVAIAAYRAPAAEWHPLGRTPLNDVRIPRGLVRVRISRAGFQPIEGSVSPPGRLYRLDPVDAAPPDMVRVVGGRSQERFGLVGELDDYWIDRFEVTNRQYKAFVDGGGYREPRFWREPFIERGRLRSWQESVERFRDTTGRPGPATWSSGTYPDGQGDFPVGGVSWYEAMAYAVFAGKSLPTLHHWYQAAALGRFADILAVSNLDGKGPAPVGSYGGVGEFGTYDMAGNVKEWCSTATDDRRFLLGGAWDEPKYVYGDTDARAPFERAPGYGFRLAKYSRPLEPPVSASVRIEALHRDARQETPVSDAIFDVYRRQYAYDRTPLNAVVDTTTETDAWSRQSVAFDAAYGNERMTAQLFLPRNGTPPYQTVVFFPPADAFRLQSSRDLSLAWLDFIVRSGRAFLYPVYEGTYERLAPVDQAGANAERDLYIAWSRDLGRAIDYLETRPDIDRSRLAFYGVSAGGDAGVVLSALEPRLKTSVLQGTGIWRPWAPEIDLLNYAPRVRMPTLMLNGRYSFEEPFETAQLPLFNLLGTAAEHKRHAVFEAGHALAMEDVAREILPWLDRYLGPVAPASPSAGRRRGGDGGR